MITFILYFFANLKWIYFHIADKVYYVNPKMKSIMHEIYVHGPVVAAMKVFADFLDYKNGQYNEVFE